MFHRYSYRCLARKCSQISVADVEEFEEECSIWVELGRNWRLSVHRYAQIERSSIHRWFLSLWKLPFLAWALGSKSPSTGGTFGVRPRACTSQIYASSPVGRPTRQGTPVGIGLVQGAHWARIHNVTWTPFEKDKYQHIFLIKLQTKIK